MAPVEVRWHIGLTLAVVLLVVGGALLVLAPAGSPLHAAGVGIVIVSSAIYLGTRVRMLWNDRKKLR